MVMSTKRYGESGLVFFLSINENLVTVSIFLTLKMSTSPLTEFLTGTDVSCRLQTMTMSAHAQSVTTRSLARRFSHHSIRPLAPLSSQIYSGHLT